ncbi:sensor histidine kinase [Nitrosovibrio sp. Nv17]|uniref:sensor histidine kinase n=1 Tax=Nitrosovibrio sp. Nv17 TaxID=1855339 RepID=UPI0009085683|nr:sensor histidine kinase [Nitrosovibrio sp. Nv17]SFW11044.1 Signal transduction histidine kinase [Nitrosovibrio sp. Nv17]
MSTEESTEDLTLDLLAYHTFPQLASALRQRKEAILHAWEAAVVQTLPAADTLTLQALRNSVPLILEEIIDAFAADTPRTTRTLVEGSKMHGASRFEENYNIRELVVEYRLLRRVIIEQVSEAMDHRLSMRENVALNMAVDTALQSGVVKFIEHLQQRNRIATEIQAKYLAFLSHDLRNHLHHALLHVQMLETRLAHVPNLTQSVANLESVRHAVMQTMEGMDRLLQAEQLRNEPVREIAQAVDLNALLGEIVGQFDHEARSRHIRLSLDMPEHAHAIGDASLLRLVLQNFLGNAIKYSSGGVVRVEARNQADGAATGWTLSVSDQGPGIASEDLEHLFDAFRRGETYGQPGVGLGLAIASEAARLLGGRLEVESGTGVGSIFRLVLPGHSADPDS